jgi:hypothetical protein
MIIVQNSNKGDSMRMEDERVFKILEPLGFMKTNQLFEYRHEALTYAEPFRTLLIREEDLLFKAMEYISIEYFKMGKRFAYLEMENFIEKVRDIV